jgi:hypothetical protein
MQVDWLAEEAQAVLPRSSSSPASGSRTRPTREPNCSAGEGSSVRARHLSPGHGRRRTDPCLRALPEAGGVSAGNLP